MPITLDRPVDRPTVADVARRAAHANHQVKPFKSLAADAAEDTMYAANRAATLVGRRAADAGDAIVYRVKRHPIQSVLITFGVGLVLGALVFRRRRGGDDA